MKTNSKTIKEVYEFLSLDVDKYKGLTLKGLDHRIVEINGIIYRQWNIGDKTTKRFLTPIPSGKRGDKEAKFSLSVTAESITIHHFWGKEAEIITDLNDLYR